MVCQHGLKFNVITKESLESYCSVLSLTSKQKRLFTLLCEDPVLLTLLNMFLSERTNLGVSWFEDSNSFVEKLPSEFIAWIEQNGYENL